MIERIVFYFLGALVLSSGLAVVTVKNTVHAALFLGLALAGVAGVFALLAADFLFAGQILIYVSGISVLIIFAVMLLGRTSDLHLRQVNDQWLAALLICAITLVGFKRVIAAFPSLVAATPARPTTRLLGLLLMGDYAVPFELISLVLTAAILGAIFFSHTEKK